MLWGLYLPRENKAGLKTPKLLAANQYATRGSQHFGKNSGLEGKKKTKLNTELNKKDRATIINYNK